MSNPVKSNLENGILVVQIDRTDKKNALTAAMYAELAAAIGRADSDPDVRVVLFTGNGGVFTAGNDLADFLNSSTHEPDAPVYRFISSMVRTDAPLVAAVDGLAVGIGTTMLLHFDWVAASDRARFVLPFVDLALVPEAASSLQLVQTCGYRKAVEMLMLGEPFGADAALDYGIVNRVCSPEELFDTAMATATRLAAKPRAALRATKRLMRRPVEPLEARVEAELNLFSSLLEAPAAREIMTAFMEKRAPDASLID